MSNATEPRPPIDARVIGFEVPVQADDQRELLYCQQVFLFDANAREDGCYTLLPVGPECVWADGVARRRKDQLLARYSVPPTPARRPAAEVDRAVAAAGPRNYLAHGGTGVEYSEATYEDQLEGLVEHYREHPISG